jgi:hypothetical protein
MADTRRPRARYTTGSAAGDRKVRAISFGAMFLEEENAGFHCSPGVARPRAPGLPPILSRRVCSSDEPANGPDGRADPAWTELDELVADADPVRGRAFCELLQGRADRQRRRPVARRWHGGGRCGASAASSGEAQPARRGRRGGESRRARPEMSSEQTWPARHAGAGYGSARRGGPLDASEASPWGEEGRG